MRIINLYNEFHLGDGIFTIHFLNKYLDYDIIFNFYVHEQYIDELTKHIKNNNIKLFSLNNGGIPNDSHNIWIGHDRYYFNRIMNFNFMFDLFYVDFFKMISKKLNLEPKILNNTDLLFDNSNFNVSINKTFDYLIINSIPYSGQFNYNENDFINLCDQFNKQNISFITTKKINSYECTLDHNMSLVDIGNLSNYCDNIISINTAPIITTFTTENIDKVKKRLVLDKFLSYSYNERIYSIKNFSNIYNIINF
jgi:hypothetical protein